MDFLEIWKILSCRGRVAHFYREECEYLWSTFTPQQQQQIYESITKKLNSGRFVHFNPANAIRDNIPQQRTIRQLSYDDYYRIFHTTEEQGGWKKIFLPEQQKTIYVKQGS